MIVQHEFNPYFTIATCSRFHSHVQSKQPRMPHKAAEERNLAPLKLIHSDLCEMNGVLTKVKEIFHDFNG